MFLCIDRYIKIKIDKYLGFMYCELGLVLKHFLTLTKFLRKLLSRYYMDNLELLQLTSIFYLTIIKFQCINSYIKFYIFLEQCTEGFTFQTNLKRRIEPITCNNIDIVTLRGRQRLQRLGNRRSRYTH